jgi:serine/threonine-protein kinase HipA
MSERCLICLRQLEGGGEYHPECVSELFRTPEVPELDYKLSDLTELAKKVVKRRVTVPGVQSKLSLHIEKKSQKHPKFTIVGLWGNFILKPPSQQWPELPANEHCTLHMAREIGIETVSFGLVRLASGELAFVTRRIDRVGDKKIALEDMCQLTGRLTEDKYKGSHEQIAKTIKKYTANPLLDVVRYFELLVFSYLTGNADMHLKNFSLYRDTELGWRLAPAYDCLSTRLVIPEKKDPEELALTVKGKKSNFSRKHFREFGGHIGLNPKQIETALEKLIGSQEKWNQIINRSFLSEDMKMRYQEIINQRIQTL